MLLCCTPAAFGLIDQLFEDVQHGIAHAAHATHDALHHMGRHEHITIPTPQLKVKPHGILVYFNNVAPTDTGIMYQTKLINEHEVELTHPDFTALFSFNPKNKMFKTQAFAQKQEINESDDHISQSFSSASQEVDIMLKSPIDISMPKIEYNDQSNTLTVFFPYK